MSKDNTPMTPADKIKAALTKLADQAAKLAESGDLPEIGQITLTAAASSPGYAEWKVKGKFKAPNPIDVASKSFSSPLFPDQNE